MEAGMVSPFFGYQFFIVSDGVVANTDLKDDVVSKPFRIPDLIPGLTSSLRSFMGILLQRWFDLKRDREMFGLFWEGGWD